MKNGFILRILNGKKSWVNPGQPSTSTAKPDRFLQEDNAACLVGPERCAVPRAPRPGETVNTDRYRQQIEKRPEVARRHGNVILLHDNVSAHKAKPVQDTIKTLGWEQLPHPPYSPDLAPSEYHLFSSMGHALAEQYFDSYEEVENWVSLKDEQFFLRGIHKLPERWSTYVENSGQYFE